LSLKKSLLIKLTIAKLLVSFCFYSFAEEGKFAHSELLLPHSELILLKKNLRFTYLTQVQQILAEDSLADESNFSRLFELESKPRVLMELLLSGSEAEASNQSDIKSEEDELAELNSEIMRLIGQKSGYFKADDQKQNQTNYEKNQKKIKQLIVSIRDKSRLFGSGDVSLKPYYQEVYGDLTTAMERLKSAGYEGLQYVQLSQARDNIENTLKNYGDVEKTNSIQKRFFRCIYAGFVVEKKSVRDRCRPVNETKLFGGSRNEMSLKKCSDPSKRVMCNPLLYGYKTNSSSEDVCSDSALNRLSQFKDNEAYCVDYGGNASAKCTEISGKEGKCVALRYIELNPSGWGELNTKLSQICGNKEINADLKSTCLKIRTRMVDLNQDVRSGFVDFKNRGVGGSPGNSK
jgi:hypothetical protein